MQFWQPGLKTYVEGSVFCAQFPKKKKTAVFFKKLCSSRSSDVDEECSFA